MVMLFSAVKNTVPYFWSFGAALFGLGLAQVVPNNAQTGDSSIQNHGRTASMPALVGLQLASADAALPCLAPPQPTNGERKLDQHFCDDIADCDISEGSSLGLGSQLNYRCEPGYIVRGNTEVYCRGRGKLTPIPKCVEVKCASLDSVSTDARCVGDRKWFACDSLVLPGTWVQLSCRKGYVRDQDSISSRRTLVRCGANGKWDPEPIRCVPVCGLVYIPEPPKIFSGGGFPARVVDFPWHATLYQEVSSRTGKEKVFICGATIIQTNLLLTAAHCVWDETYRTKQEPSKLFVATGNVFRDYDSPLHDPEVVRKATVKNVYTYCQYYGLTGNYASDIAVLELHAPFEFSSILMPVCLDISENSDQFLGPGAYGRVAGFGKTETGETSGNLQTLTLPYVSYIKCKNSSSAARNEAFITSDKFCAGYNNGSAVCEGDSGGGLVFKQGDLWYIMGIVSVGLGADLTNGERACDLHSFSLYTKVPLYMTWIRDILAHVERNQTFHACSDEVETTGIATPFRAEGAEIPMQTANPCVAFGCLAPPRLANGGWKLHQDSCQGTKDCLVSEGTMLLPGSQLVYSCTSGYMIDGPTDVHCRLGGTWTTIPTCTVMNREMSRAGPGDKCIMRNGDSGVCTLIKSCEPVLQALKTGNAPENTCGFAGRQPIVCCPIRNGSAPMGIVRP